MSRGSGWHNESYRHSLAARGVATKAGSVSHIDFPVGGGWDTHVAVYVPGTLGDRVLSNAEHKERAREVQRVLAGLFGGYTAIEAMGGWVSPDSVLVEEPVVVVHAYTDQSTYRVKDVELEEFVVKKLGEWDQEMIGVELDDELFFIEG